jgi:hypothetical protein
LISYHLDHFFIDANPMCPPFSLFRARSRFVSLSTRVCGAVVRNTLVNLTRSFSDILSHPLILDDSTL